MNFKTVAIICLLVSCGVKTAPKAPSNSTLPSITEKYQFQLEQGENEKEKDKADLEQKKKI
ncbi:MAG: hypothetical protein WEB87_05275 [Bacteriovoracaceae bacterium]